MPETRVTLQIKRDEHDGSVEAQVLGVMSVGAFESNSALNGTFKAPTAAEALGAIGNHLDEAAKPKQQA